jgi:hypothetical protein
MTLLRSYTLFSHFGFRGGRSIRAQTAFSSATVKPARGNAQAQVREGVMKTEVCLGILASPSFGVASPSLALAFRHVGLIPLPF